MDDLSTQITRNIKGLLRISGRNQSELAAHFGKEPGFISKRLAGHIALSIPDLRTIADFLEVDPDVLLKSDEELNAWLRRSDWIIDIRARQIAAAKTASDQAEPQSGWTAVAETADPREAAHEGPESLRAKELCGV